MSSLPKHEYGPAPSAAELQELIDRANHLRSAETGRLLRKLFGLSPDTGNGPTEPAADDKTTSSS